MPDNFLRNDGDDVTSGKITATGFTTIGAAKVALGLSELTYITNILDYLVLEGENGISMTAPLNMALTC